jgi:hypothetical protein
LPCHLAPLCSGHERWRAAPKVRVSKPPTFTRHCEEGVLPEDREAFCKEAIFSKIGSQAIFKMTSGISTMMTAKV